MLRSPVPCNGCTACCKTQSIILDPTKDNIADYQTIKVGQYHVLQKTDNGCIYLSENGCSIYERRPHVCRVFDCRRVFYRATRSERKRMIKDKLYSQEIFDAARERLNSLTENEKMQIKAERKRILSKRVNQSEDLYDMLKRAIPK